MSQMGCTQAKKQVFLYITPSLSYCSAVRYSCSGHCSAADVWVPEQPKQGARQGKLLCMAMWGPIRWPRGRHSHKHGLLFFFLSLKDTVVLHRAQMLATVSSCVKKYLQSLWLLKHRSCGTCNFHHLPLRERWDFSLRGMHVVPTLSSEYVPPSGISQPSPPPQSSRGFWFPVTGGTPQKKSLLEGASVAWANYHARFTILEALKLICRVKKGKVATASNVT